MICIVCFILIFLASFCSTEHIYGTVLNLNLYLCSSSLSFEDVDLKAFIGLACKASNQTVMNLHFKLSKLGILVFLITRH